MKNTTFNKIIIKNTLNINHNNIFKNNNHTYTNNKHHPYNIKNKKPSNQFILIFKFPYLNTIHIQKINIINIK